MGRFVKFVGVVLTTLVVLGQAGLEKQPAEGAGSVRFVAMDLLVDSGGEPLAAWQVEVKVAVGDARVAGVEGGESAAFRAAPYYDPRALLGGRIIVAAFSLDADLPRVETRVARLHMEVHGAERVEYLVKVMAAAGSDGRDILVKARLRETP